jgi:peptidoglycan/LPS O-acetylase OafA/YrhL
MGAAPTRVERGVERVGYRPALDGLRAVAIGLVIWHHTTVALLRPGTGRVYGGFLGVDVFFVLSGFLITNLLIDRHETTGRIALAPFYRRRAVRLLPALVVFLAADTVVASLSGWDMAAQARTVAAALAYVTNWAPTFGWELAKQDPHLWTLAVEEQFYLIWPLLLAGLLRLRADRRVPILVAAFVGVGLWRAFLLIHGVEAYPELYQRTDTRIDTLLAGAILALVLRRGRRGSDRLTAAAGIVGAVVLLFIVCNETLLSNRFLYLGGFSIVAVAAALVIAALLVRGSPFERALSIPPAVHLGRISYSCYLWHLLVFILVRDHLHGPPTVVRVAVAWTLALAVSLASFWLVERPVLDRRRRRLVGRP